MKKTKNAVDFYNVRTKNWISHLPQHFQNEHFTALLYPEGIIRFWYFIPFRPDKRPPFMEETNFEIAFELCTNSFKNREKVHQKFQTIGKGFSETEITYKELGVMARIVNIAPRELPFLMIYLTLKSLKNNNLSLIIHFRIKFAFSLCYNPKENIFWVGNRMYLALDNAFPDFQVEGNVVNAQSRVELPAGGEKNHCFLIGGCYGKNREEISLSACETRQKSEKIIQNERTYWEECIHHFRITVPDENIMRQFGYSVCSSLATRSRFFGNKKIFLHGAGGTYDWSTLHQSYPLHTVALAVGESESVAQELEAYAAVQHFSGAMFYQLSPHALSPYFSYYEEAFFIRALYQYLCWTGDFPFLSKMVLPHLKQPHGFKGTILEHARKAADYVLENLWNGVVPPMDWHDSLGVSEDEFKKRAKLLGVVLDKETKKYYQDKFPVCGACQGSMVWYQTLNQLSEIFLKGERKQEAQYYSTRGEGLKRQIEKLFYNPKTGLYGEILNKEGLHASHIDDFWSYPQIWAILTGMSNDRGLLDAVRKHRLTDIGVRIVSTPQSAATDNMLDIWPEKTYQYALAETLVGRPDYALDAIKKQLPENIHRVCPETPPWYHSERYGEDGRFLGWTWSGDAEFLRAILKGFCGVKPTLEDLVIEPRLPGNWVGKNVVSVSFFYRQQHWNLVIDRIGKGDRIRSFKVDEKEITPKSVVPGKFYDGRKHAIHICQ